MYKYLKSSAFVKIRYDYLIILIGASDGINLFFYKKSILSCCLDTIAKKAVGF